MVFSHRVLRDALVHTRILRFGTVKGQGMHVANVAEGVLGVTRRNKVPVEVPIDLGFRVAGYLTAQFHRLVHETLEVNKLIL